MLRYFIAAILIFLIGCSKKPSDTRTNIVTVKNEVLYFEDTPAEKGMTISIYLDDKLKKETLPYGHSYQVIDISDGHHALKFELAPEETGTWGLTSYFNISNGANIEIIVDFDGTTCTNCSK